MFFSDPRHLELTLATIFRPHNSYCVHVDHKSSALFRSSVSKILECYRRKYPGSYIYPATMSYNVYWGHFSIVEAELICMRDLLTNGRNWSYALNMAGSEVMLATNLELVNILSQEEGQRYSSSFPMPEEWKTARVVKKTNYEDPVNLGRLGRQEPTPHNIKLYAGGKFWLLPRHFIKFIIQEPVVQDFLGRQTDKYVLVLCFNFSLLHRVEQVDVYIRRDSDSNLGDNLQHHQG